MKGQTSAGHFTHVPWPHLRYLHYVFGRKIILFSHQLAPVEMLLVTVLTRCIMLLFISALMQYAKHNLQWDLSSELNAAEFSKDIYPLMHKATLFYLSIYITVEISFKHRKSQLKTKAHFYKTPSFLCSLFMRLLNVTCLWSTPLSYYNKLSFISPFDLFI